MIGDSLSCSAHPAYRALPWLGSGDRGEWVRGLVALVIAGHPLWLLPLLDPRFLNGVCAPTVSWGQRMALLIGADQYFRGIVGCAVVVVAG